MDRQLQGEAGTALGVSGLTIDTDNHGKVQMSGTTDKIKGTIKEAAGKVTGDKRTEAEGKTDQAKGDLKNAAHDAKEGVKGMADSLNKK